MKTTRTFTLPVRATGPVTNGEARFISEAVTIEFDDTMQSMAMEYAVRSVWEKTKMWDAASKARANELRAAWSNFAPFEESRLLARLILAIYKTDTLLDVPAEVHLMLVAITGSASIDDLEIRKGMEMLERDHPVFAECLRPIISNAIREQRRYSERRYTV